MKMRRLFSQVNENAKSHAQDVNCVAWHPNGGMLISCSDDGEIKVWKYIE